MRDVYLDYESYKLKLHLAQKDYDKILCRKEELFRMTQPSAVNMDDEKVSGGSPRNSFDSYLIIKEKENLDERLREAKEILDERKNLLETVKRELKESPNVHDKIYYLRYIEHYKVNRICRTVGYSEAQVYRILKIIREKRNDQRRATARDIVRNKN